VTTRGVNGCKRGANCYTKRMKADATKQPTADAMFISHEISSFRLQHFYIYWQAFLHVPVGISMKYSLRDEFGCVSLHCAPQHNLRSRQVPKLCRSVYPWKRVLGCRGIRSNRFIQTVELKGIFALKTVALGRPPCSSSVRSSVDRGG